MYAVFCEVLKEWACKALVNTGKRAIPFYIDIGKMRVCLMKSLILNVDINQLIKWLQQPELTYKWILN